MPSLVNFISALVSITLLKIGLGIGTCYWGRSFLVSIHSADIFTCHDKGAIMSVVSA